MAKVQKLWILFPTRDEASSAFGFNRGNRVKYPEIEFPIYFAFCLCYVHKHDFVVEGENYGDVYLEEIYNDVITLDNFRIRTSLYL